MRTTDDLREELRTLAEESHAWALPPVPTGPTRSTRASASPHHHAGRVRGAAVVLALAAAVAAVVVVPQLVTGHDDRPSTRPTTPAPTPLGDLRFEVLRPSDWSPAGRQQLAVACGSVRSACLLPSRIRVDGRVVELGFEYASRAGRGPSQSPEVELSDTGTTPWVRWLLVKTIGARPGTRVVARVRGHGTHVLPSGLGGPTLVRVPSDATCGGCRTGFELRVREDGRRAPREHLVVAEYTVAER